MVRQPRSDEDGNAATGPTEVPLLDRRSVVRGGLGAILAGSLAGCQSSSTSSDGPESDDDEPETTDTGEADGSGGVNSERPENLVYQDNWGDGELDGWTTYIAGGDAAASVETMSTPSGGSHVLRLSHSAGYGTELIAGTQPTFSGWDRAWTVRTAFHTTAFTGGEPSQKFDIVPGYDPDNDDDPAFSLGLGFRDGDGQVRPTAFYGPDVEESETEVLDWEEDSWYDVEFSHDGTGAVSGTVWPSTSSKPSSPTVQASVAVPSSVARPVAIYLTGNQDVDFQISHSFIRLSGDRLTLNNS